MAKKIKVCLDAGHYGKYNRSPAVSDYYESDMTWKLHKLLKESLEAFGIEVITTRAKKKEDMPLLARGRASKGCDLFLSLHSNAVGNRVDNSVDRVDIYAPLNGKAHDLARRLADAIVQVMGTRQRGYVKTREGSHGNDYYSVIQGATEVGTPGLLIEHSFHTNLTSALWLMDDVNLEMLASAEAAVIADYYGLFSDKPTEPAEPVKMGDRSLVKGMAGPDVRELKHALIKLGYSAADDVFDVELELAVNAFKADCGLEVNGKAGCGVFRRLAEMLADEEGE